MARPLSLLLLLAAALAAVSLLPLLAAGQGAVSVAAPFTSVNVGWNGDNGNGNDNGNDDDDDDDTICGVNAQWLQSCGGCSGGLFRAKMDGRRMIAPNSTTPAPIDTPAKGRAWGCVSADGQTLVTRLELCSLRGYVASHHHFGGSNRDFPPPIVAIEPASKPSDPLAPPTELPMLTPPADIGAECRTVQATSTPSDLIIVPGGPPTWSDLLAAMGRGEVYVNAHTTAHPEGEIRGNFEKC